MSRASGGRLPMNASLASALALHDSGGLPHASSDAIVVGKSAGTGTTNEGRSQRRRPNDNNDDNARKKTSIRALAAHPSLPRVAYLAEETMASSSSSSSSSGGAGGGGGSSSPRSSSLSKNNNPATSSQQRTTVKHQRIVVRRYDRNARGGSNITTPRNFSRHHSRYDDGDILASLPMEKLPPEINRFRRPKSKSSKLTNQPLTLASLGPLQSITFLDREALFWQTTRRRHGSPSNLEPPSLEKDKDDDEEEEAIVLRADSDWNDVEGGMGLGRACLGLQFSRALIVLRFDDDGYHNDYDYDPDDPDSYSSSFTVLSCLEGQRSGAGVVGGAKDNAKIQYVPSSAPLPLTESVVVYGCTDGAMRFHEMVHHRSGGSGSSSSSSSGANRDSSSSSSSGGRQRAGGSSSRRQATIKSVRGPNGRDDPVVAVLNVDPVRSRPSSRTGVGEAVTTVTTMRAAGNDGKGAVAPSESDGDDDATALVLRSRLLTACSSGVAFLWDVRVTIDRSSGALRDLNVLPPLVRLDGLGSLTMCPRKPPGKSAQASSAGGFWGRASAASKSTKEGSGGGAAAAPYSQTAPPCISHDPHRHLLTWALPSDAPAAAVGHRGDYELESLSPNSPQAKKEQEDRLFFDKWVLENGGFVKVWDLNLVDILLSSARAPSSSPRPPPKMPPVAIIKLPTTVASIVSPHGMMAGLSHAPIAASSLTCVCLSRDGSNLIILAAPLPGAIDPARMTQPLSIADSPVKSNRKKLDAAKAAKPKVLYVNSVLCHSVSLAGGGAMSPFARGSSVAASYLTPNFVGVATDHGVAVAQIVDGESWSSRLDALGDNQRTGDLLGTGSNNDDSHVARTHSSSIPAGPIHTIISIGAVGNRPGILFVENSAVYASRLGTTLVSSDQSNQKQVHIESVDLPDPVLLCKLHGRKTPWRTIGSTRMANFVDSLRPINCPPRLISSPSGRYLCLYWGGDKKRFEILHAGSLLAREQSNPGGPTSALDGSGQRVTPFIDSGRDVLSFAWVGDDDNFAILRQSVDPTESNPKRQEADSSWGSNSPSLPQKGEGGWRKVELYKIAEVKVDAVELAAGASIAAATAVRLGNLTVRGGDRVTPNILFGGPALCVGCLSVSDRSNTSHDDGIAYFYSRKRGAIEKHDERASVYTTIGTSVPYPDRVTWDDYGQLCAISYGSRVAVYLSEETKFVLLGSVRVVGSESSDSDLSLISLKFIHGVLYCSTQSSVHAIFLGDLEDDNTVCELDSYTIATDRVPLYGINNPDLSSPVPMISALAEPHILAYHSGGLLVSTLCGLRLLPLSHPIIRIGTLLAANLTERARKWILAIPKSDHDYLANFLIRRGHVDLAINDLNGLSLEAYIDLCIRYERTDELEHLIDAHGAEIVHDICDWGRGEANGGYSGYFAIGIYLLGKDKVGCARKLATQAVESGINELLVDAMKLATFISVVDQAGGNTLLQKVTHAMDFDAEGQIDLVNIVN